MKQAAASAVPTQKMYAQPSWNAMYPPEMPPTMGPMVRETVYRA